MTRAPEPAGSPTGSTDARAKAGVAAGDEADIDVVTDTGPRAVQVPADLAAALDRVPAARRRFDKLSYTGQQRHVLAIEQPKTTATRERRIEKSIADLSATTPAS